MELLMHRAAAALAGALALAAGEPAAGSAGDGAAPAIDSVAPVRADDVLAATVRTSRLPGSRLATSIASGLPSAIEMRLEALDRKNRRVGANRLLWRITWDLWDEVLRIEGPDAVHRLDDLASLEGFLAELKDLPVTRLAALDVAAEHRLRVACRLHPIAPPEAERLSRWVAGGEARRAEDPDGREVSVGLSQLIRFFYKGAARDPDELDERFSAWFVPAELAGEEGS
jgi:hypothetical protein